MNVRPRPSQSRALIPLSYRSEELAEATGLEPARALRGDLANRCHTVRRRLQNCFSQEEVLEEGTGVEPASDKCAVVFGTTALPVRLPFQEEFRIANCELRISNLRLALSSWLCVVCWQGRSDLNRESRFWRPMVCRLAYIPEIGVWCMR